MKAVIPNADETELMKMAVRMPDALKTEREEIDENEWKKIQTVIDEALENIAQFRKDEGVSLEREFLHQHLKHWNNFLLVLQPYLSFYL